MVNVVLTVSDHVKSELGHFSWINWSEVAREEVFKRATFEKYLKTGELSDEDWEFCDRIDWHPVDDLPLKKEFIDRLKKADEGKFIKVNSIDDIFED
ncbi:MAG: hypothetical protein Q7J10_06055 [Methanosarcinaceae archaeon]|nr:hypothetical protein [Methanosarcinaceae archaeon]